MMGDLGEKLSEEEVRQSSLCSSRPEKYVCFLPEKYVCFMPKKYVYFLPENSLYFLPEKSLYFLPEKSVYFLPEKSVYFLAISRDVSRLVTIDASLLSMEDQIAGFNKTL